MNDTKMEGVKDDKAAEMNDINTAEMNFGNGDDMNDVNSAEMNHFCLKSLDEKKTLVFMNLRLFSQFLHRI